LIAFRDTVLTNGSRPASEGGTQVKRARRALLRHTVQGRRRLWVAGPTRWLIGALLPLVPAGVVAGVPAAEIMPGFLFLVTLIGTTVLAGRGPGVLSAVVSAVALGVLIVTRPWVPIGRLPGWWGFLVVFLVLSALAVIWLDSLLADAARRATAVLDPLVETAPVGIAMLDAELRFALVNPALAELSRLPPSAHVGRRLEEVVPHLPTELHEQLQAVLTTGVALRQELVRLPGHGRPGRDLLVDAFPIRPAGGADGPVLGLGAVVVDVTEQHRLQQFELEAEQLRATAELHHRLLETQRLAGLAEFSYDAVAHASAWSAEMCALLGRADSPATIAESNAHVHPDEFDRVAVCTRTTLATGAPYTIETRMVRTDGKVLEVLLHAEAIWDGDEVIGMWGVLQDVTNARAHADKLAAAEQAAQVAWEHALAERGTLTRFQQALLPTGLPEVPGATLAADYFAVADRIDVGGDWYDAFELPDGRICLSIGDVMGHDLQAAATMGQIRAVTRGYAAHQPDPGSVLTQLNRLVFLAYPSDTLISAVVFLYEPTTGRLRWANAGHPHPLVAHPTPGGAEVVTHDHPEPNIRLHHDAT
jgi:phosphoserine phosphatase RsbU/P